MWFVAWMAPLAVAGPSLEWTAHAGVQSSFGLPITALDNPREPTGKISVPVEGAIGLQTKPGVLLRAHVGAGVLLNGTFIYSTTNDELVGLPHHVDLLGSVGLGRPGWAVGALGGVQFPSRPTLRGFVRLTDPEGPLSVELRGGANFPTQRPVEPVFQVLVGVHGS